MATIDPLSPNEERAGIETKEHIEGLDAVLAAQSKRRASFDIRYPGTVKPGVVPLPGDLVTPAQQAKAINGLSPRTFPRLSKETRQRRLGRLEKALNLRKEKYLKGMGFPAWSLDKVEDAIIGEFAKLNLLRQQIWYKNLENQTLESHPDFDISQAHLENSCYRKPHLIAFDYNKTDKTYNSNTVLLGGLTFFALEAPSKETVTAFRNLMHNHEVKTVVRLTAEREGLVDKCYNYWSGHLSLDGRKLKIPLDTERSSDIDLPYEVDYIATDTWDDNSGGSAKELLELIFSAREYYDSSAPIAVHCHSGVARTGTFIVGFALVRDIDRQLTQGVPLDKLEINVAKFFMEGSLQRFYHVGQPQQYVTVHRMLALYVKGLLENKYKSNYKRAPVADVPPLTEVEQLRYEMDEREKKYAQEIEGLRREIKTRSEPQSVASKNEGMLFVYNLAKYVAAGVAVGVTLHTLTKYSSYQPK